MPSCHDTSPATPITHSRGAAGVVAHASIEFAASFIGTIVTTGLIPN